jgi:hypothetical protein
VAWCCVLFVVRAFELGATPGDPASLEEVEGALTTTMWATFVPAGLLGGWASYMRLKRFNETGLRGFRWIWAPTSA